MKKINILKNKKIKDFLVINLGVFIMAAAYSLFIDSNNLIVGGVGGIATILKSALRDVTLFGMPIGSSLIILVINIILLILSLFFISKDFFFKTLYASIIYPVYIFIWEIVIKLLGDNFISLSKVALELEETLNLSTTTVRIIMAGGYLLYILFGAVMVGTGLGLAVKKGASTGGVDIVQKIFLKYFKIPLSVSLFIIDGSIVLSAALYFQDILTILYGVAFIYLSGYVLDSIAFSGFNSRAVSIVTKESLKVKEKIYEVLNRGVTEVYVRGGYIQEDSMMLVCIMSNHEFYKIRPIILEIDSKAFIYVTRASEVHGEGFSIDKPFE